MRGPRQLLVLVTLGAPTARAQDFFDEDEPEEEVNPYEWNAPTVAEQLAEIDPSELPLAKGGIFVPTLSDPANEPPVLVVDQDKVRTGRTGEVIPLRPGSYVVIISSGSPKQGVAVPVEVFKGEVTAVPVQWGGLRVEVVDSKLVPQRAGYDVIHSLSREPYGTGFGVDTLQGESLRTWLLPPGLYRIVQPGGNYRSRTDFATVQVPEGGFVRYRLVVDTDTGEFRGAGVVLPGEFGSVNVGDDRWFNSMVIGADGSLTQTRNQVGDINRTVVSGQVFWDTQLVYSWDPHFLSLLTQVEEGISQDRPQGDDPEPLLKTRDSARADVLYTYFFSKIIGPYIRGGLDTQVFPTRELMVEDTTIVVNQNEEEINERAVLANETFRVSGAFEPTVLREGAGMNIRMANTKALTFNLRLGLGLRQNLYGGALLLDDDDATPNRIEYERVGSFGQRGAESTIIANARLPGFAVYSTDLELFVPFPEKGDRASRQPSIEWNNALTARITENLSVRYSAEVAYLPIDDIAQTPIRLEQSVLLRASWQLF
ncbi:MAG: hypothetical protein ACI8PZ_000999 [Myxococcota bacterium]|jgi:hypothetical protein